MESLPAAPSVTFVLPEEALSLLRVHVESVPASTAGAQLSAFVIKVI